MNLIRLDFIFELETEKFAAASSLHLSLSPLYIPHRSFLFSLEQKKIYHKIFTTF